MSEKPWQLVLNALETLEKRIYRLEALEEDIAKQVKDLLDGLLYLSSKGSLAIRDLNKENKFYGEEPWPDRWDKCPGGYKDCNCKGDKHPWVM